MIVYVYQEDGISYIKCQIPAGLEQDLLNWLEWAEKQNERNKKWEEMTGAQVTDKPKREEKK